MATLFSADQACEIAPGGWGWKRTSFLLHEFSPRLNDLAQFTLDFSFIKTAAARTDHTRALSNEHSVFIGPFNNSYILLGVRWLDTALVFSGEALCSSKRTQKCYAINLWECKESRSATIPKLRRAGALPKGGRDNALSKNGSKDSSRPCMEIA